MNVLMLLNNEATALFEKHVWSMHIEHLGNARFVYARAVFLFEMAGNGDPGAVDVVGFVQENQNRCQGFGRRRVG